MPNRDFLSIPALLAIAQGREVTLDRSLVGYEQSCSFCGAVLVRREPGADHAAVKRYRYILNLKVQGMPTDAAGYELVLPLEACEDCIGGALAPYAAAIEAGTGVDLPTFLGGPEAVAAAVDEHPHGPDITHERIADVDEAAAAAV